MDIGDLTGPVLLFGGPYSNLHALKAIMGEAARRGIPPSNVICTGDVVAYCGDPAETVATIRAWGCHVVAGNCEEQLAAGAPDCGCGFEEGSVCNVLSAEWYAFASGQIDADARRWMSALPSTITFQHAGKRWAVIHGGATETNKFVWSTDSWPVKRAEIELLEASHGPLDGVVCGHTGFAFVDTQQDKTWLNAGVIGIPAHNGRRETEFVVMDGEIALLALAYDAIGASRAMSERATPYREALTSGWWPSEDALPQALRREA